MMKMMILLFLVVFSSAGISANKNGGKTGLAFLKVGIDARATGMAEAYTAVAEGASSVYWNPAGLVNARSSNVLFNHNEWILDTREEFAALSLVSSKSAWGFHLRSFNIGDIEVRSDVPTTDPLEITSAHYFSAGMSYARKVSSSFNMGITLKYLFEKIYVDNASGFGVDLGMLYRTGFHDIRLGAVLQNLGRMGTFRQERTRLPLLVRLGAEYPLGLSFESLSARLAADLVKVNGENLHFHAGTELLLWKQLAVRTGVQLGYDAHALNFGIGFNRSSLRLDYAIVPFSQDLGTSHQFTLSFDI
jgi:hypothetical protein